MDDNRCCICNILNIINILQNNVEKFDNIPNTCDRPFLGFSNTNNSFVFNTRPITLYTRDNSLLSMPYTLLDDEGTSSVFRVEKVNGCCATLRVLASNPDTGSVLPYVSTDSFFTVNCNCICAIQCLADTFIGCV